MSKRRYTFARPMEALFDFSDIDVEVPNTQTCNTIDVEWDTKRPPSQMVTECIMGYRRKHGDPPAAVLLGWELILMLAAEVGPSSTFMGVPILAYPWQFRLGCAPLMPGAVNNMLRLLGEEKFPFEQG